MIEYYKVVVLRITVFETTVEDERHFPTIEQAYAFVTDNRDLASLVIRVKDDGISVLTA